MNLVYFVETGSEIKITKRKGKKKQFFEWINSIDGEKWRFLAPCEAIIESHDSRFRTAEFHEGSTLRNEILRRTIDPNDLIGDSIHYFLNGMWPNILSVMRGHVPMYSFQRVGDLD